MEQPASLADELVSPTLQLLQALRAACGGDLELNIILLAIAERTIAHPGFRDMSMDERMQPHEQPFPTRGVNIRSIADSTGIPRETVRRKVANLERRGWITRTPDSLHLTPTAYRALTPAREELMSLALKFHDLVAQRTK
ncbi:helix-turn-helix domain-containing protein [Phenylobacterium sp.]|jgi:DNA-binding MarR family transcriptional regulator|uniref:helix-turn-helix domain-containing protein n=1 Tax=Phenylobacterium sp. TaxID=1871053 RepID=UPI002F426453